MDKFTQLEKLSELKDKGILTEEEFQIEKEKILQSEAGQVKSSNNFGNVIRQERYQKNNYNMHQAHSAQKEILYNQEQIETRNYQVSRQNYDTNNYIHYGQNPYTKPQITNEFFSFSTFFSWNGRVSRSYFWGVHGVYVGIFISMILLSGIMGVRGGDQLDSLFYGMAIILSIFAYWSHIVVSIKRFHDLDQTGWFIFIPFYNFIGPAFIEGTHGPNKYGSDSIERYFFRKNFYE